MCRDCSDGSNYRYEANGTAERACCYLRVVSPGAERNLSAPGLFENCREAALGVIDPEITCSNCLIASDSR